MAIRLHHSLGLNQFMTQGRTTRITRLGGADLSAPGNNPDTGNAAAKAAAGPNSPAAGGAVLAEEA